MVLDIETLPATGAALELELDLVKAAGNIKDPAKIKENISNKKAAMQQKAALLDSAPIGCIGLKVPGKCYCFTSFSKISVEELEALEVGADIVVVESDNEAQMLETFNTYCQSELDSGTEIITFNGYGFDLPKIRGACARLNTGLADVMGPRQPGKDLMINYSKYYSQRSDLFISLDEVVRRIGICDGKLMSGKFFYDLIEKGDHLKAVLYNVIDCYLTEQVYFRMTK